MGRDSSSVHFNEVTRSWFANAFAEPTAAQQLAWPPICAGDSTVLLAPTGSGKTLAAFLSAVDRLMFAPPPTEPGVRVVYVSPLKALAVDVERNLRSPLIGITALAASRGVSHRVPTVAIRTGDTPQRERARMMRTPPDILITTPESLYLMATSKAREMFRGTEAVIIDEVHTMVNSKRGVHLMLTLERIEALRTGDAWLQRIGLSATQRPLDEVARFLGGFEAGESGHKARPVTIVDAGERKALQLSVEMPVEEVIEQDEDDLDYGVSSDGTVRSSWAYLTPRILELIRSHRSSIIFVNSRRSAEKLAAALNEAAEVPLARAHHGSIAHNIRAEIEEELKEGQLPAIVATASLELGIDMGAVELVIQVGAFPSVSSGLQRVGRARHHVGGVPEGVSFPKHAGDLLASAAVSHAMLKGDIEASRYPRNPLDVLAQQVAAMVAMDDWTVADLHSVVRRCAAFHDLSRAMLESVLDMMSGRYPADDFSDLRPTIVWDRVLDELKPRKGLQRLAVVNGGTIADRGLYGVYLYTGNDEGKSRRVGELDEEMVFESRVGDVFLLGASSWRIEEITHDQVLVTPAPGVPGKMPFWKGDQLGRSYDLGCTIGAFCGRFDPKDPVGMASVWAAEHGLAENAVEQLWTYLSEQTESGVLPTDRRIVIERFMDEIGDWRICILSPFGSAVHAPWAMAVQAQLLTERGIEVDTMWSDDGMVFRVCDGDHELPSSAFTPAADAVEDILLQRLSETPFFGARFRENAGRSLLLPKRRPGKRSPLWALRRRAASLLKVASQFRDFPIVLETYRECLVDHFDMASLKNILNDVGSRRIAVQDLAQDAASPFASNLMFQYVANFIYEGDAPLAERRAQALTIDQSKLRELMGEAALRSLLDADSIHEVEEQLQRIRFPANSPDALHAVLLELGPLSSDAIRLRFDPAEGAEAALERLTGDRRVFRYNTESGERIAAVEDAARLRDALGIVIPVGVPLAFQEPVPRPARDLVRRYCRTHGPATAESVAVHLGLAVGIVREQLGQLEQEGQVLSGEFTPDGVRREWCDVEVLRRIKRKALSKLRAQVEAVDPEAYVRFLHGWHGIDQPSRHAADLLPVIDSLQGYSVPSGVLENDVLRARIDGYHEGDLDALCASGQVVWTGNGSLGKDIRVQLYRREHMHLLHQANPPLEGELAGRIREILRARGGLFFEDLKQQVGGFPGDILDALLALVRNGEVSNDTLMPLRSLRRPVRAQRRGGRRQRNRSIRASQSRLSGTEGRWWLVESIAGSAPDPAARGLAVCTALLDRYGVLCREAFAAESIRGGFSQYYPVLKALEERGKVRRGFYVDTVGATQFSIPGVDDQLRQSASAEAEPVWLSVVDPAQPYGSIFGWPTDFPVKPTRKSGGLVLFHGGQLVALLASCATKLLVRAPDDEAHQQAIVRALSDGLHRLPVVLKRRSLIVETINGRHAREYPGLKALQRTGVGLTTGGIQLRLVNDAYGGSPSGVRAAER